jgi:glycogen operon protein
MNTFRFSPAVAALAALVLIPSHSLKAAVAASDNACDPAYNGPAWNSGSNGGNGFGGWGLAPGGGNATYFIGDARKNGVNCSSVGIINSICSSGAQQSWGLWAQSKATANAIRPFAGGMQTGQTFTISMDNGTVDANGSVGFSLENCQNNANSVDPGNYLFQFYINGSQKDYFINDAAGGTDTGIPYTENGLTIAFTLGAGTAYSVTIMPAGGGTPTPLSGKLANPSSGGQAITQVRLFNYQDQAASCPAGGSVDCCHDLFFNNMSITVPPLSGSMNLGAKYDAMGQNVIFRVYSSSASRIDVYTYSQPTGAPESYSQTLTPDPSIPGVWAVTIPVSRLPTQTIYYGYRAWGPNWPYNPAWTTGGSSAGFITDVDCAGNRFNPNKLLLDPYALEVSQDPFYSGQIDPTIYASGTNSPGATIIYRTIDDGQQAPKGIVLPNPTGPPDIGTKPTGALKDDIIYEVHLRGLTMQNPNVPAAIQGTYAGAATMAPYLAGLGVTAVEFLPVQESQNDANDVADSPSTNYWGYASYNFFAPDRRYSSDKNPGGPTSEFQAMVKAFHNAGLKVFLDVVYNHTGEGYAWRASDPSTYNILSWRGLDNPTYYCLTSDLQYSWDNSGTGGNYNTFNPVAQRLILDSLEYDLNILGVDGFRFDEAAILGNTCQFGCFNYDATNPNVALNQIAAQLGGSVALIAEPWDSSGLNAQGKFPAGWSEWNGVYSDTFRKSQNKLGVPSYVVTNGELATRFAGSSDLFNNNGRSPWNSINNVVTHDGFTLHDLYSYDSKQNESLSWPYGPSDGGRDDNISWDQNFGQQDVAASQRWAARNGFSFLMLSAGTPMFDGGDEFLRTVMGNNNAYDIDSTGTWLDWSWPSDTNKTNFYEFVRRLIAFRLAHPALRPANFFTGTDNNSDGMDDIDWFKTDGTTPTTSDWNQPNTNPNSSTSAAGSALAYRIDGTKFNDPSPAIYVAYNGWSAAQTFTLPSPGTDTSGNPNYWWLVMDTSVDGINTVAIPSEWTYENAAGATYNLLARSVALMVARAGSDFYVRDWTDAAADTHDEGQEPSTDPQFYTTSDVWNQTGPTAPTVSFNQTPPYQLPIDGQPNYLFARVCRNGPGPAETVTLHFVYSDFGNKNPFMNASGAADPTINFAAADTVHILGDPTSGASGGFQWMLPANRSLHVCIAVEISAPGDLFMQPSLESTGWYPGKTDYLVLDDNNKAQFNILFASLPGGGGNGGGGAGSGGTGAGGGAEPPPVPFYAIAHNAHTNTYTMVLQTGASASAMKWLGKTTISVVGGSNQVYKIGDAITLPNMRPGEDRWISLTVGRLGPANSAALPVTFTEMVDGKSLGGFAIAPRAAPLPAVLREDLQFYVANLNRLSVTTQVEQVKTRVAACKKLLLAKDVSPKAYVALMRAQIKSINSDADTLSGLGGSLGDPFDLKTATATLNVAVAKGNAVTIAMAQDAFLQKFDAYYTMFQKSHGQ